ncbi:MAG: hypothetical protein KDE46_20750, partial [Caldilineaceae bacterium]|nr:hypothetical protein [Caldilineaceae bacterium]
LQRVAGVQHVLSVKLKQRAVAPGREREASLADHEKTEQDVDDNKIQVAPDMLLCSLNHQITIVTL